MKNVKEEWRNLGFIGYPNYEISNTGQVMSLNYGIIKYERINKQGYRRIRLYSDGKKKEFLIHRLVALAFVDNPNKDEWNVVNHKDENKLNNNAENLEWCDNTYNVTYGTCIQRRVATRFKNSTWNCDQLKDINRKPVYKYDLNGSIVYVFKGINLWSKQEKLPMSILRSKTPIKNGYVYSMRDDLTVDDIWDMVYAVKSMYDKTPIPAYQYDFNCNLITEHKDIMDIEDMSVRHIKLCIEGKRIQYNRFIWSSEELSNEELKSRIDVIMKYKPIYRYSIHGGELHEYENIDCIEKEFDISKVRSCCNGIILSYDEYIWSYDELEQNELNNRIENIVNGCKKKVYQYNLLGEFVKQWDSIEDCIRGGFIKSKLHDCFNMVNYQHKGYLWSKNELCEDEINKLIEKCIDSCSVKPVYQYTKSGELICSFNTVKDASDTLSITAGVIHECCRGGRKSYKGYVWSYKKLN